MQIRYGVSYKTLRGNSFFKAPSFTIVPTPVGSVSGTATVKDAVFTTQTGTRNSFKLVLGGLKETDKYEFNSLIPATCTIDSSGNASYVANGTATIDIVTSNGRTSYSQVMSAAGAASVFSTWKAGTAAEAVNNAITSMASGKTAGAATQSVFSAVTVAGTTGTNVTRNASLFTGALDLTAISVSTDNTGCNEFPVVLISPWHVMAGHVGANGKVVFKDSTGAYITRNVVSQRGLTSNTTNGSQVPANYVALLDAAVTTITPMAFLPTTYATQLPCFTDGTPLPLLNKGWAAGDFIRILTSTGVNTSYGASWLNLRMATDAYSVWSSQVINGDSNGPIFIPVNGVPALLGCMNTPYGAVMLPAMLADIQAQINAMANPQTLVPMVLTGFPTP